MNLRAIPVLLWAFATTLSAATFTVTNVQDSGPGSLRQAIADANTSAGMDTIAFAIASAPPHVISTASTLSVSDPVVIDGTSQPGYAGSPLIEIRRVGSTEFEGFVLAAGSAGSTVRALEFTKFNWGFHQGVALVIRSDDNHVRGCHFGTAPGDENAASILVQGLRNLIGGTGDGDRNVVSGGFIGISVGGAHNSVVGNYVGVDESGVHARALFYGIIVTGGNATIGGPTTAARNVIGSASDAIRIHPSGSMPSPWVTTIEGNWIGVGATGVDLYNGSGINFHIPAASTTWRIRNNLIANNEGAGVLCCSGTGTISGNTFTQNSVGVNTAPGGLGTTIASNEFFGNDTGILLRSSNDEIRGNQIHANSRYGLEVTGSGAKIGGTGPADANVIRDNRSKGVLVWPSASNVSIRRNSITGNRFGIDLLDTQEGVTPNDAGDVDEQPGNRGQNFPVLVSALSGPAGTIVQGTLNSYASHDFTLEFFSTTTPDPTQHGQGENFLGDLEVHSDASGNASFTATLPRVSPGQYLTATATGLWGTSEFSKVIDVQLLPSGADVNVFVEAPTSVAPGAEFTIHVRLANDGPESAAAPQLLLSVPSDLTLLEDVPTDFPSLAAGAHVDVTLRFRVGAQPAGNINLFVKGESTTPDPNLMNNVVNVSLTVDAFPADLEASIAAPVPVALGDTMTLTATIENHGPGDAQSASLTIALPDIVALETVQFPAGECSGTTTVVCNVALLQAGAKATATLTLNARAVGTAAADVSAASMTAELQPADNTASVVLQIVRPKQRSVRH